MENSIAQPAREQRRAKRIRSSILVELVSKSGNKQKLRTVDVCRHGLFVATETPPRERFLMRLNIHLPDGPLPATAFVSRSVTREDPSVPGVGLQLFALAAASKARWDQFIFSLEGKQASPRHVEREALRARAPGDATFLIKLKDLSRLQEFYDKNVGAGGLYMATPVIKETGAEVALVIIHPVSEQEFVLQGSIERVCREHPKGMEIKLHPLSETDHADFRQFIRTGVSPEAPVSMPSSNAAPPSHATGPGTPITSAETEASSAPSSPPVARAAPVPRSSSVAAILAGAQAETISVTVDEDTGDLKFEITVDESLLDGSDAFEWNEVEDDDLIIDFELTEAETLTPHASGSLFGGMPSRLPMPIVSEPPHPGHDIEPSTQPSGGRDATDAAPETTEPRAPSRAASTDALTELLLEFREPRMTVRITCEACGKKSHPISLGGTEGLSGALASDRPYWCTGCETIVAVTRIKPAEERRKVLEALERAGDLLETRVAFSEVFRIASLVGVSPKCPACGRPLRLNGTVKSLALALPGLLTRGEAASLKRAPCASCRKPRLRVERIDGLGGRDKGRSPG